MRRRPIAPHDSTRISHNWEGRIWGNIPGLNSWAIGSLRYTELGIPQLTQCDAIPDSLFPWEEKSKYKGAEAIHFYCEDVYLSSIWNSAKRYPVPAVVRKAGCALTPDYSVFTDWPYPLNLWQVYKARLLGALWTSNGINVIPSLMWGHPTQFEYLFDGLPYGGTFAISTGHSSQDEKIFKEFYIEALARCQPSAMLVYGQSLKPWIEKQDCPVRRYDSRLTQIRKQRAQARKRP